jgi:hypothetical protein
MLVHPRSRDFYSGCPERADAYRWTTSTRILSGPAIITAFVLSPAAVLPPPESPAEIDAMKRAADNLAEEAEQSDQH